MPLEKIVSVRQVASAFAGDAFGNASASEVVKWAATPPKTEVPKDRLLVASAGTKNKYSQALADLSPDGEYDFATREELAALSRRAELNGGILPEEPKGGWDFNFDPASIDYGSIDYSSYMGEPSFWDQAASFDYLGTGKAIGGGILDMVLQPVYQVYDLSLSARGLVENGIYDLIGSDSYFDAGNYYLSDVGGAAKSGTDAWEFGFKSSTLGSVGYGSYSATTNFLNGNVNDGLWDTGEVLLNFAGAKGVDSATSFLGRKIDEFKIPDAGITWGGGIKGQGLPWEDYLEIKLPDANRLTPNFKTFDFFDQINGTAISAKTLNTQTAARLARPEQLFNSLKGNIDTTLNFNNYTLGDFSLLKSDITSRQLQVAVPSKTNSAQWDQIQRAIEYGASKNVEVVVTPVR